MSIQYEMREVRDVNNPANNGMLRAKAISRGTVNTDELVYRIVQTSGFKHGDVQGLIVALDSTIMSLLAEGYDVQLGDLGYLSVSLTSQLVKNKREIRAESIKFKTLNFRISRKVRNLFKFIRPERLPYTSARSSRTPLEKKEQIIRNYLKNKPFITRIEYSRITGTLKDRAIDDLKAFIEAGWLKKHGKGPTTVYTINNENT